MCRKCNTKNDKVVMLPCSGASNLGQLANQAAVQLAREGVGNMSCLAGIGAHIENFVRAAKQAGRLVAIDGCALGCTKKVLEHADIPADTYVMVSELGFEKNMNTVLDEADVERVKSAVKSLVQ
ncbi:MAG: putative zinc-binding protein [Pseudomonadota bacterium]